MPKRPQLRSIYPLTVVQLESYVDGLQPDPYKYPTKSIEKRFGDRVYLVEVGFRLPFEIEEPGVIILNVTYEY
ncbi:unnamed protein product [Dibothriocephalus latus]|uniref:Uncharacterized protein n=1 Tax=Dibothriocephalus latus TaxID=60516 RepID=A0A3P7MV38_DIBLA|nr:unnamed protein product [Dibothriocephalus latus]